MADLAIEIRGALKIRENAARREADCLGYTLQKSHRKKITETNLGGYRLLDEEGVYQGKYYSLSLSDVEQTLTDQRKSITNGLFAQMGQREEETQDRLRAVNVLILKERLRSMRERLEVISQYLRNLNACVEIMRSRFAAMDQRAKFEYKKMEIVFLRDQIKAMETQKTDPSGLIAIQEQLELEIEMAQALEEYQHAHI